MLQSLIRYQIYIIIAILVLPISVIIFYFIKNLIERVRFIHTLNDIKKPLLERINHIGTIYDNYDKDGDVSKVMKDIQDDIMNLKESIDESPDIYQLDQISQIEKEISQFYEQIQELESPKPQVKSQPEPIPSVANNENIGKFFVMYKEKDSIIEEKNRTIEEKNKAIFTLWQRMKEMENKIKNIATDDETLHEKNALIVQKNRLIIEKDQIISEKNSNIASLQKRLQELESRIKTLMLEAETNKAKDNVIQEKNNFILSLQQRLQDIEQKFKQIAIMYKNMREKESIKDTIITEKNTLIMNLQNKLQELENNFKKITTLYESKKETDTEKKLSMLDERIRLEKRKNRIFIILFLLICLVGVAGVIVLYNIYAPTTIGYTI